MIVSVPIEICLEITEIFAKYSALNGNGDKSKAIWIWTSLNFRLKPRGLIWTLHVAQLRHLEYMYAMIIH